MQLYELLVNHPREIFESLKLDTAHRFSKSTLLEIASAISNFNKSAKLLNIGKLAESLGEDSSNLMPVYISDEFNKTIDKWKHLRAGIKKKIMDFVAHKSQYPCNGGQGSRCPGFAKVDKQFASGGTFDLPEIRNIAHCHLTGDISLVYLIRDGVINLYGIYSHDDIGTGQPANLNRQKQKAAQWTNAKISQELDWSVFGGSSDQGSKKKEPAKTDYTPKVKAAPTLSLNMDFIKQVSNNWLDRNLESRLASANGNLDVIKRELQKEYSFLSGLKTRPTDMQMKYVSGVQNLISKYLK